MQGLQGLLGGESRKGMVESSLARCIVRVLAGAVFGFVIGFVGGVARIDTAIVNRLCLIVGALTGIPVGLWVVKKVLQKRFGDFRIALLTDVGCASTEKDIPVTVEFDIR